MLVGNKPIFNKVWYNAGILCIKDLLIENRFMSQQELEAKYNINTDFLFYYGIKTAIPCRWLEIISSLSSMDEHTSSPVLTVQIKGKQVDIRKVTCKQYYWSLVEDIAERPTSYFKWESYYYYASFDWIAINQIPYDCTSETFLQSFQYKIIHRYFPCKYNLHLWNLENNNICVYCNHIDTLSHYFAECTIVTMFWISVKKWFLRNFEFSINCTPLDILIGIPNFDKDVNISIFNFVVLFAKYFVYCCKQSNKPVDFFHFLVKLKTRIVYEEYRCKMFNKIHEFEMKWALINIVL